MSEPRKTEPLPAAPILIAVLVTGLLGAYVGGYFFAGTASEYIEDSPFDEKGPYPFIVRAYPYEWQASVFKPAGKIEGWLRGGNVEIR